MSATDASTSSAPRADVDRIDVDADEHVRSAGQPADRMDEEMASSSTSVIDGTQTPASAHTLETKHNSDLASSFYHDDATHAPQTVIVDDDDDDLMEPDVPGRDERLLDEKIRARYIQEIGDIFASS